MKAETKTYLIEKGTVTEEQFSEAETAADKGESLEASLMKLGYLSSDNLGKLLSEMHQLPYVPLASRSPAPGAASALSRECARRWITFPVDYNPKASLLTLAVADLESAAHLEKIYRFLLEPTDLAFTIASETEIKSALVGQETPKPKQKLSMPAPSTEKPKQKLPHPSSPKPDKPPDAEVKPAEKAPAPNALAEELINSLTSAASLLVAAHLASEPRKLAEARTRVRYCQLTATRLNLSAEETTKTVLAAWLSALEHKHEVIRQFTSPYDLEAVVFAHEHDEDIGVAAKILALVRCYQGFEEESPGVCRDVNQVRRALHVRWPEASQHQDVLETFLQVLMDEQFLDKFDQHAGAILIIDPSDSLATQIEPVLRRSGYDVGISLSIQDAKDVIYQNAPGLLILTTEEKEKEIRDFCRAMKADTDTREIPLIILLSENASLRGTDFLRAGADDFLPIPMDVELLYLKLEKAMATSSAPAVKGGVSGSLADMSFTDMLQVLTAGAKSTELTVTRGDITGRVYIKEGNIVHAEVGDVAGDRAFYQLMRWDDGDFTMVECKDFPEPSITSSTMSLLMEGARLADEDIDV